jgi:hypothetical protein
MHEHKMRRLIELFRHTPAVRSCVERVFNEIVPVIMEENGKELTTELQIFLGPVLAQFFEQALEMA